jgi:lysophospholipid acyltransferase (LPLAT)-like uncharacterized protein
MPGNHPQSERPARSAKPRKSGVVIPNSPRWYQWLAASVVWLIINLVSVTIRYRVQDPHGIFQRKDLKQTIYCFWHNRLSLCVKLYFKYGRARHAAPGVAGLVSASKDGALLSAIFACFGVQPVRGSSSRRGAQALMELTTWAQRGYDLAITPDGPRGPKYVLAEGAITLAQITGLPLVAASYHLTNKIALNSWDQFQIPLPFSRCDVVIGKVFQVPRELTDTEREKFRNEVESELRAITRD